MRARCLALCGVLLLISNVAEGAEPQRTIKSSDALYLARLIAAWLEPKTSAERSPQCQRFNASATVRARQPGDRARANELPCSR
jgi:hypothetical protein